MLNFPDITTAPKNDYSNPNVLPLLFKAAEKINHDYDLNRETYFKNIKTPVDNVRVDSKDFNILKATQEEIATKMNPILKDNAFHKASEVIFDIRQSLSNNQLLKMAQYDYNARMQGDKDIDEGATKDWSPEYRAAMKRMRAVNSRSVYTDENGQVQSGYANIQFSKAYDDKDLKDLLSNVSTKGNYGVSSSNTEQLVNVDSQLQKVLGKGIEDLTDANGNKMFFGSATTKFKGLSADKVRKAVIHELSLSKDYQNYLKEEARLSLFMAQDAKTASIKGKRVTSSDEFVKFDVSDVFNHFTKSANEQNYIQQLIAQSPDYKKQVTTDGTVNGKQDPAKVAKFAATYYKSLEAKEVDLDGYYKSIVTRDHVANTINGIAANLGNRLSYTESSYSLTLHKNPQFETDAAGTGRKAGRGSSDSNINEMHVSDNQFLTVSPNDVKNQGNLLKYHRQQLQTKTANLNSQLANIQAPIVAQALNGLSDYDRAILTSVFKKDPNINVLKRIWRNENVSAEDAFKKYEALYNTDGTLKETAFGTKEAYNKYKAIKDQRDIDVNTERSQKEAEESFYMMNQGAINGFYKQYVNDTQIFHRNARRGDFIRIARETLGDSEFDKTFGSEYRIRYGSNPENGLMSLGNDRFQNHTTTMTNDIRKYLREHPDLPNAKKLESAYKHRAFEWTEINDVVENYMDKNPGGASNLRYNSITHAPETVTNSIIASLTNGTEVQVLYSSDENAVTEFGTLKEGVLGRDGDKIAMDIKTGINKDVSILPVIFATGGYGAKVVNRANGTTMLVKTSIPQEEIQRNSGAIIESALNSGNYSLAYQQAEMSINRLTNDMPIDINDDTKTLREMDDHLYKTMKPGTSYTSTTYLPDSFIGDSPIPVGLNITRNENGRFSFNMDSPITTNAGYDQMVVDYAKNTVEWINSNVLNKRYMSNGEVENVPVEFNNLQAAINYITFDMMYTTKFKRN